MAEFPSTSQVRPTGEAFTEVFDYSFDQKSGSLRGGGVSDRIRHDRTVELHYTMHKQGWEKATVINLNHFELRHGMGALGEIRIPKRKEGEPYTKYTIRNYRVAQRDFGDAKFVPEAVLPVQIAEDVCLAFKDYGGVLWYRGEGEPDAKELKNAIDKQLEFMKKAYQRGLDTWSRTKQLMLISDHMKHAAKELFRQGSIAQLPEWCTVTRVEADRKVCDNCGEDIKFQAKTCIHCGFIIDKEFYEKNKDRFTGSTKVKPEIVTGKLPQAKHDVAIETFMNEPDPDANNQIKALEEHVEKGVEKTNLPVKKGK